MSSVLIVTNLSGVKVNGGLAVKLTWDVEEENNPILSKFNVYRSDSINGWSMVTSTTEREAIVSIDSTYDTLEFSFKVEAEQTDGTKYTTESSQKYVFTKSVPKELKIDLNKSGDANGIVEGIVIATASAFSSAYAGALEFCYFQNIDNQGWVTAKTWTADKNYSFDLTNHRGKTVSFKISARNSVGEADFSTPVTVRSNNVPITPSNLISNVSTVNDENNIVTLSWDRSFDPDLGEISYSVFEVYSDSTEKSMISTTANNVAFTTDTYTHGQTYKYYVVAYDKFDAPSQKSNIVSIFKEFKGIHNVGRINKYAYGIITFTWLDDSPQNEEYDLYISKNGGEYLHIGATANKSYRWPVPASDPGETSYRLKIVRKPGVSSESIAYSTVFYKPTYPTEPVSKTGNNGYHESSFSVSWNHSNWYNQGGKYYIDLYADGIKEQSVYVNSDINYFTFNITSIDRGKRLTFTLKAVNDFNQESELVIVDTQNYRNRVPANPQIIGPLNDSTIYSKTPRIVIYHPGDLDGQNVSISVMYNGNIYNSINDPSLFSKDVISGEGYLIFKHTEELNFGSNTIGIFANDGLVISDSESVAFTVSSINTLEKNLIKSTDINEIINALNLIRESYNMSLYNIELTEKDKTVIKAELLNEMTNSLNRIIEKINSYHPESKFDKSLISLGNVNSQLIKVDYYNNIINAIQSL